MTKHIKATAEERMKLIAPLLSPGLDKASFQRIKDQISQETGLSERTIRRYLGRYQENGFAGLSPAARTARQSHAIPEEILQEAILLRRQVPGRSVAQLIQILEWEGKAQPGQIKRSTLQEKLSERGYSSRQMKQYNQTGTATRRFVKPHRNCLWMSDVKYAIYLPIGPSSKPKQVYLVTWIDDCTRFILHSEFYASLEKAIVIDSFRQALIKHGLPDSVYFDNGSEYRNKWMQDTTGLLGIKLMYARPYSPESKGKSEIFHQRVDSFLSEVKLENVTTLDELNRLYQVWLQECYQYRPHSALKDNQSPVQAFQSDKRPIRYADPKEIHEAFLHREERKVDKTGCISFCGKPYEVGLQFLGMKVTVIYDPTDISVITVQGGNLPPVQAKERVIGQWVGPKPTLPEHLTKEPATESRLLKAALKKHQNRDKPMLISYKEAGEPDV
ncbi:MAG: DDE-type integrase/transposase/recombinase [Candidatus Cloacimonadaceae bacterium]